MRRLLALTFVLALVGASPAMASVKVWSAAESEALAARVKATEEKEAQLASKVAALEAKVEGIQSEVRTLSLLEPTLEQVIERLDALEAAEPEPTPEEPPVEEPPVEEEPAPEEPPTQTAHCFSAPAACGFPAPSTTGVPAGTTLTASGAITASTAGQVISGKDVTGGIDVTANNVTIQNSRVSNEGNCGGTSTCGNWSIRVASGVTGTVIRNVETVNTPGTTCEHDIRNQGDASTVGENLYLHACDSNWYGDGTLRNSYGVAKKVIKEDHVENVYYCSGTFTADHDTLFNPVVQTAVIFGDTICGGGNHYTVKNSLLAGGGFVFYPQANNSNPAGAQTVITGNHLARCLGPEHESGGHWYCTGTTINSQAEANNDGNGYFPNGGSYNVGAYFSGPTTWSGNVWDDNLAIIPEP